MDYRFSKAFQNTSDSFIKGILDLTKGVDIISFAGGLPNADFFPVKAIKKSANAVLKSAGKSALQYASTDGYLPLRQWIAARYLSKGIKVDPEQILITTGSQQALDLIGKVFLDRSDYVTVENPSYLGAIQAFQIFGPQFDQVPLTEDGVDVALLEDIMSQRQSKFFYAVPNFQNPTGLTYSLENRQLLAEALKRSHLMMVEDDPYGELRFMGDALPPVFQYARDNVILLGSFSKICAPGLRLGWLVAAPEVVKALFLAKESADLHSSTLVQYILHDYLTHNDFDAHLAKVRKGYYKQRNIMVNALKKYMPKDISFTEPEGGMFLWLTLPEDCDALKLFPIALKHKVAFVPGAPFSVGANLKRQIRLSYSTTDRKAIVAGVKRLAAAIEEMKAE